MKAEVTIVGSKEEFYGCNNGVAQRISPLSLSGAFPGCHKVTNTFFNSISIEIMVSLMHISFKRKMSGCDQS